MSDAEELKSPDELMPLIMAQITPFFMKHNAEAEAIDLLMEVGRLEEIVQHVDKTNWTASACTSASSPSTCPSPRIRWC